MLQVGCPGLVPLDLYKNGCHVLWDQDSTLKTRCSDRRSTGGDSQAANLTPLTQSLTESVIVSR